jgi:hypothetical protein
VAPAKMISDGEFASIARLAREAAALPR